MAAVQCGNGAPEGLGPEYMDGAVTDIVGVGQDNTSTALSRVLVLLLKLQRDVQAELGRVVRRSQLLMAEDQPRLPLLDAFIYETRCYSSFVPITIPHATTEVELEGFHVPEGTMVFIDQWSVNHEGSKWCDPQHFDPSRFLDRDCASSIMIFSTGQQRCIGNQLAKLQLFLFTAILLLHQCSFHPNHAPTAPGTHPAPTPLAPSLVRSKGDRAPGLSPHQ